MKPARIRPMRKVAVVGRLAAVVEPRSFRRMRVLAALQTEANLLEVLRIGRHVFAMLPPVGFPIQSVLGQKRVVCVAEDVGMRAVRASVPTPPRSRRPRPRSRAVSTDVAMT